VELDWPISQLGIRRFSVVLICLSSFFVRSSYGQEWTRLSEPLLSPVALTLSADGNRLMAMSEGFWIFTSPDSGLSWNTFAAPGGGYRAVAASSDGTKLIVAGREIRISTDGGNTWPRSGAPVYNWNCVASSADGSRLAAAARFGPILVSTNSGQTWTLSGAPSSYYWSSLASSADGSRLVAVPENGPVLISTNSGLSWSFTNVPIGGPAASSADGSILLVAESGAGVYLSRSHGRSWFKTSAPASERWTSVAMSADGSALFAASVEDIYASSDWGVTWVSTGAPASNNWQALASSADGQTIAAVGTGGIYGLRSTSAPRLTIAQVDSGIQISWTASSATLTLQESPSLHPESWTDVPLVSSSDMTGLHQYLIEPAISAVRFYRLVDRNRASASGARVRVPHLSLRTGGAH
jgi:hypothetical protein